MKKLLLILSILLTLTLSACGPDNPETDKVVYVTVYPMEFIVSELVGDTVTVKTIPGASTHGEYAEWTAKQIIDMKDSQLLFYINGGADTYVPDRAEVFEDGDVELIDMSQHLEYNMVCYTHTHDEEEHTEDEHTDEENHNDECDQTALSPDPHFWLDPVLMLQATEYVKDKLIATYPENSDLIENNFTVLKASLTQLNSDYEAMALEATKPIITTVMLFTYWHERYDIEILSITTDSHSSEVVPGDIIDFVNHATEDGIEHILFEKNANSPAGDAVLTELRLVNPDASPMYLHGLGSITPDEREQAQTYLTIMYDNLEVLKSATK